MKRGTDGRSKKLGIFEYIKKYDEETFVSGNIDFSLEMFGNTQLVLYGCRRIIRYTFEEMILEAKNFDVRIVGHCLVPSAYHMHGVEISGDIEDIEFITRG